MRSGKNLRLLKVKIKVKNNMSRIFTYIEAFRFKHLIKNGFIFFPVLFSGLILNKDFFYLSLLAFISFTLQSWAIYLFNDLFDLENDRVHPEKKYRPLASGRISKTESISLIFFLSIGAFLTSIFTSKNLLLVVLTYLLLNILYTIRLKRTAILDTLIVSSGFVLRLVAGSVVTNISLSKWIIVMTFLLALFLSFAKRRKDVLLYENVNIITRISVKGYSLRFIDSVLSVLAAIIIVAYLMYSISDDVLSRVNFPYFYATTIFVIAGLLRYFQQIIVFERNDNPINMFYSDRFLMFAVLGWFGSIFIIFTFYSL